jgi:hypothetical protein
LDNGKYVEIKSNKRPIDDSRIDWSNFKKTLLEKGFVYVKTVPGLYPTEVWALNYQRENETAEMWVRLTSDDYLNFNGKSKELETVQCFKEVEFEFFPHNFDYNYLEEKIKQYCAFKRIDHTYDIYRRIYLHPDGIEFAIWIDPQNNSNHIYVSHAEKSWR